MNDLCGDARSWDHFFFASARRYGRIALVCLVLLRLTSGFVLRPRTDALSNAGYVAGCAAARWGCAAVIVSKIVTLPGSRNNPLQLYWTQTGASPVRIQHRARQYIALRSAKIYTRVQAAACETEAADRVQREGVEVVENAGHL